MARSHLQMPATLDGLAHILEMVTAFCGANKLPEATCSLMNLALDEILSNIIKYAYDSPDKGTIDVELAYSSNKLTAFIEDRGIAFDPFGLQSRPHEGPLQTRKEGGLGIFFVKSLLDGVGYERIGDRNKVTLTINVPSEQP